MPQLSRNDRSPRRSPLCNDGPSGSYQRLVAFICPSKPFGHVNFGGSKAPARRPIESDAGTFARASSVVRMNINSAGHSTTNRITPDANKQSLRKR